LLGVLTLETLEHASSRGAPIIAELRGFGSSADGHHISQPSPGGEGAALAMVRALQDARMDADSVHYINAHATSTPQGDAAEVAAIRKVCVLQPSAISFDSMKVCNSRFHCESI
jgi:3-oxoacyl-[acyl-carrier-protein] synthase II